MTISEIAKQVVDRHSAMLIKITHRDENKLYRYDTKPLTDDDFDEGSEFGTEKLDKDGWVLLDAFTAGALKAIYEALSAGAQAKFDTVFLTDLVKLAWKAVA